MDEKTDAPESESLVDTLLYGLSLPERSLRSASAVVGGLVNETAARLIPAAFRTSRSYTVFVQQALDMMIHDVGGVTNPNATDDDSQLAQKAVGGLLDIAGAATLHLSPLTVLALFSDIAYGSSTYLKKLSEELKKEGIIDENSSIDQVSDLVDALQATSVRASDSLDKPPISVDGITLTIAQLSEQIATVDPTKLLPKSEVDRLWGEMELAADKAHVGLWDIGATMTMFALNRVTLSTRGALSSVRVAGNLVDEHIFSHYALALEEISEHGFYETLANASAPYLDAVWHNFDEKRETWTEGLLNGTLLNKAWVGIRGWFGGDTPPDSEPPK